MSNPRNISPQLLDAALKDGATLEVRRDGRRIPRKLTLRNVGCLQTTTGRLIVGDLGLGFDCAEPFSRAVSPGTYSVFVSIWGVAGRKLMSPSDGMGDCPRVAYIAVRFSDAVPARYEFAGSGDNTSGWIPDNDFDGFGVDVGPVGILDSANLRPLRGLADTTSFMDLSELAFRKQADLHDLAGMVEIPTDPPLVIPAAESGWGDGAYFSYWGLSKTGEPAVLITDFDLENKWERY